MRRGTVAGRRAVLLALAAPGPGRAASGWSELVEAAWAARRGGPGSIAAATGADPFRPEPGGVPAVPVLRAEMPVGAPFAAIRLRLAPDGAWGIAELPARPGHGITAGTVRALYPDAVPRPAPPAQPHLYLSEERPGGFVAFAFPRAGWEMTGELLHAVLNWRDA